VPDAQKFDVFHETDLFPELNNNYYKTLFTKKRLKINFSLFEIVVSKILRSLDLAGTQATSANVHCLGGAVNNNLNSMYVSLLRCERTTRDL
jgi:hypothetical protein